MSETLIHEVDVQTGKTVRQWFPRMKPPPTYEGVSLPAIGIDSEALYEAIEQRRNALRLSWREMGRQFGLWAGTFQRFKSGKKPDADTLIKCLVWLEIEVPFVKTFDKGRGQEEENKSNGKHEGSP